MNRRDFLKSTAVLAAGTAVNSVANAQVKSLPIDVDNGKESAETPLITSAPMLQNYAERSMGIAFSVSHLANGFVIYGEKPDLSDGKRVMCGGFRVMDVNPDVMLVRLNNLKPNTKYYYKIGAHKVHFRHYYDKKVLGTVIDDKIYSFTTAGKHAESHFCVINDTHKKWEPFRLVIEKVTQIAPSCVVWNGDAMNVEETIDDQKRAFLYPEIERKDFASNTPYLLCPGNHDDRGWAGRSLEKVWMFRQPDERSGRDWDLGRNFAVRMGDIAMIGLDTGEDKVDENPRFIGVYNSEDYRVAQKTWLEDALKQPQIASAPFLVAFCHIPLFDPRPNMNPGDVHPADKDEKYTTDFAIWQRTCANLWTPLLEKAGCQLIITGHQHQYRYDAPTKDRKWAQIVGGGPHLGEHTSKGITKKVPSLFPTVIEGKIVDKKLQIIVHNAFTGQVQDTFTYNKRK